MASYRYYAQDEQGRPQRGTLTAETMAAAEDTLRGRGWTVVSLELAATEATPLIHSDFEDQPKRPAIDPLLSLRSIAEELPPRAGGRAIQQFVELIEGGNSYDAALQQVRNVLPSRLITLVELGLERGRLDAFLEHYLESTRRATDARHQVVVSLGYPLLMMLLILGVIYGLLIGLVPMFDNIFQSLNMTLPGLTLLLLGVSQLLRGPAGITLLVLLALSCAGFIMARLAFGPRVTEGILREIPVLGKSIRLAAWGNLSELLALLVETRMPLPDALLAASRASETPRITRAARLMANWQSAGTTHPTIEQTRFAGWPEELGDVFRWATRPGDLVTALRAAAEIFIARSRVNATLSTWIFEPLILVVLVSTVGLVVIGLMMPLIKLLNDLA